jgi:hypothetical protein
MFAVITLRALLALMAALLGILVAIPGVILALLFWLVAVLTRTSLLFLERRVILAGGQ